jgi:hypothetical protein
MLKVLGFLAKREGIEIQAFIDYYENKHVPLICSLAPTGERSSQRRRRHNDCLMTGP